MWKKEDRKAAQRIIKRSIFKRQVFRVHQKDGTVQQTTPLDLGPRFLEHLFGQVDANELTARSNFFCCRKKIRAPTYSYIQHPGTLVYTDTLDQTLSGIGKGVWSHAAIGTGNAVI